MDALLIINSLLVAVCVYFIQDFHKDFKKVADSVQGLKEQVTKLSRKVNNQSKKRKRLEETEEKA